MPITSISLLLRLREDRHDAGKKFAARYRAEEARAAARACGRVQTGKQKTGNGGENL
jgi:hypothetical protein